jgi:hypothetical protein
VKLKLPWPPFEAGSCPLYSEERRVGVPWRVEVTVVGGGTQNLLSPASTPAKPGAIFCPFCFP